MSATGTLTVVGTATTVLFRSPLSAFLDEVDRRGRRDRVDVVGRGETTDL